MCTDKGQEEPSYFSIAFLHTPNVAPKWGSPLVSKILLFNDPIGKERMAKRSVCPLLWERKNKLNQSRAVSIIMSEITCNCRSALEPGCVPAEQRARHASTHPEEATNCPPHALKPPPPTLLLLLAMSKPPLRHKEQAGTEGVIQLPCCTFSMAEQGSILPAHRKVQAQGLSAKLSFHVINSQINPF